MKIEIKELSSVEWESEHEIILDENTISSIQVYIGTTGSDASDGFEITLCNTDYVKKIVTQKGFFMGLWHLIIDNPSRENIKRILLEQFEQIKGATWEDFLPKLRRIGYWEFEDYNETFKE